MRSVAGNNRAIRNKGRIHFDPKFQRTCPRKMNYLDEDSAKWIITVTSPVSSSAAEEQQKHNDVMSSYSYQSTIAGTKTLVAKEPSTSCAHWGTKAQRFMFFELALDDHNLLCA